MYQSSKVCFKKWPRLTEQTIVARDFKIIFRSCNDGTLFLVVVFCIRGSSFPLALGCSSSCGPSLATLAGTFGRGRLEVEILVILVVCRYFIFLFLELFVHVVVPMSILKFV